MKLGRLVLLNAVLMAAVGGVLGLLGYSFLTRVYWAVLLPSLALLLFIEIRLGAFDGDNNDG